MKVSGFLGLGLALVLGSVQGAWACSETQTIGTDYFGAKSNCEVILQGQAHDCQYENTNLWRCGCTYACSNPGGGGGGNCTVTRTTGTDYFGAKTNCEVILRGTARNCQYENTHLWACDCYFNCG